MPILQCYVDDRTFDALQLAAANDSQKRTMTELAEAAISDAAIRSLPPQAKYNRDLVRDLLKNF